MYDTLKRQDYLYTLLTRGNDGSEARVVQSIVGFLHVPEAPEAALQRLEKEDIRILSLTVTEKGYYRTPDGGLDTANALVKEDLNDWNNGLKQPKTAPGLICTVLLRRRGKAGPLTVMSCDNLPLNGNTARDSVLAFARLVDQDLANYIANEVPFPNAMVDRITPVRSRRPAVPSRHLHESSPRGEVVGGFFFDFEAIRTESSDRDAPRRSRSPNRSTY